MSTNRLPEGFDWKELRPLGDGDSAQVVLEYRGHRLALLTPIQPAWLLSVTFQSGTPGVRSRVVDSRGKGMTLMARWARAHRGAVEQAYPPAPRPLAYATACAAG
jgi:hypothetical protein